MDISRISPVTPMMRAHKYDDNEQKKKREKNKDKSNEKEKSDFKKNVEYVKYIH
jgi:hypothetical protein